MIRCNACGQQNEEGVRTCVFCGTPMDEDTQSQYTIESPDIEDSGKKKKRKKESRGKSSVSIPLFILSILIPIAGIILFIKNKSTDSAAAKKYLIASIITCVLSVIVYAVFSVLLLKMQPTTPPIPESTTAAEETTIDYEEGQPVIGTVTTTNKSITVDDITVTVTENKFVNLEDMYGAPKGYNILKLVVTYTNNKDEDWWIGDIRCSGIVGWSGEPDAGAPITEEFDLNKYSNSTDTVPLAATSIKAGETLTGVYYYNVHGLANQIQLEYNSIFDATPTAIVLKSPAPAA